MSDYTIAQRHMNRLMLATLPEATGIFADERDGHVALEHPAKKAIGVAASGSLKELMVLAKQDLGAALFVRGWCRLLLRHLSNGEAEEASWELLMYVQDIYLLCDIAREDIGRRRCYKCTGTGQLAHYRYYEGGVCFRCHGTGWQDPYKQGTPDMTEVIKSYRLIKARV